MEYREAITLLKEMKDIDVKISELSKLIVEEREIVNDNLGAMDYTKDRVQSSNHSDLADIVIMKEETICRLKAEVKRLQDTKDIMLKVIS